MSPAAFTLTTNVRLASKPSGTRRRLTSVRAMETAPTTSSNEQATCAAINTRVIRRDPATTERDSPVRRIEGSDLHTRTSDAAAAPPAQTTARRTVNKTRRESKRSSNATCEPVSGIARISMGAENHPTSNATAAAAADTRSASTASCRTSRQRPAPIATRTPNSVCRETNRDSINPPVFAHATTTRMATSASPSHSGRSSAPRAPETPRLALGIDARSWAPLVGPGMAMRYKLASFCSATGTDTPGRKRATTTTTKLLSVGSIAETLSSGAKTSAGRSATRPVKRRTTPVIIAG